MLSLISRTSFESLNGENFISINKDDISGHPNIMKLYDVIDHHRHVYLVIEYCRGKMLSSIIREYKNTAGKKSIPESICRKIY